MSVSKASTISDITISAISTRCSSYSVTQSIRVSTAARKRKFDSSHSGCNSKRCTLACPIMDIVDVDVHEIFRQLKFARYGEGPFDKFRDWKDINLWKDLLRVLVKQRSFLPIKFESLFFVISHYAKSYANDTHMKWLTDEALKRDVAAVFKSEPLADQKGCLSIEQLEEVIQNMKNTGLLVNEEQVGENSFNSGGRKPVKIFRGSRSSSSVDRILKCSENIEAVLAMDEWGISKQLNHLFNTDQLSARQVNDTINNFFSETGQRRMRAQMWSQMSEAKQLDFIKDFSPSTIKEKDDGR